jgi:branched-chain amino acid transport system permease protein
VGWLYGGIIGAIIFSLMQDWLAGITPQYWEFWIGLVLVALVLVGHDRLQNFLTSGLRTLFGKKDTQRSAS